MIGIKIHGGLGNQLFQYAFIYTTAKKLNTSFYLDEGIDFFKVSKYFNVTEDYFKQLRRAFFNIRGFRRIVKNQRIKLFDDISVKNRLEKTIINGYQNPDKEIFKLKNNILYEGFFQSEKYFDEQKNVIKSLFTIKNKYVKLFEQKTKHIDFSKNIITVHIRRDDYLQLNWQLSIEYYHKAIAEVEKPDNYYIFITDDPDFVALNFSHIHNKYISSDHEIIDFQFLLNSNTNILANSSFSWWGSYLNKKDALTIAPKLWLGQATQYPNSITCEKWLLI